MVLVIVSIEKRKVVFFSFRYFVFWGEEFDRYFYLVSSIRALISFILGRGGD